VRADQVTRFLFRFFVVANRRLYELTGGGVGGSFKGAPVLLLRVRGRRSGRLRVTPLLYLEDGDRLVVVASAGGSPRHPGWFHNLRATPAAEVQVGRERRAVQARVASAEERTSLWPRLVSMYAEYETYQARTEREIPVVILEPRGRRPVEEPYSAVL
jgi:deazaflavin-dependent oxidoreductase (nitroreductase family)